MLKIIFVLALFIQFADTQCQKLDNPYVYKHSRPTTEGIRQYVEQNQEQFFQDFRTFVGDTLDEQLVEDTWIEVDDLSTYMQHDSLELGCYYYPNEIICTCEELYVDYSLKYLSKYRRSQFLETNQFVYSTVIHEISHMYFQTLVRTMRGKTSLEFHTGMRVYPYNYGAEFIEEGLCEYIPYAMQEIISFDNYVPVDKDDVLANRNTYAVKYRYARIFVTPIVEKYGIRKAVEIMISNPAPTIEEILHPQKYYSRLVGK